MAEEKDMTPTLIIGADPDLFIGNPDNIEAGPRTLNCASPRIGQMISYVKKVEKSRGRKWQVP